MGHRACLTLIRIHPEPVITFNKVRSSDLWFLRIFFTNLPLPQNDLERREIPLRKDRSSLYYVQTSSLLFKLQGLFMFQRSLSEEFLGKLLDSMSFATYVNEKGPPYRVCDIFDKVSKDLFLIYNIVICLMKSADQFICWHCTHWKKLGWSQRVCIINHVQRETPTELVGLKGTILSRSSWYGIGVLVLN